MKSVLLQNFALPDVAPAPLNPPPMTRKPKRKLNSYNFFFQHHRQLILDSLPENVNRPKDSHGKISFQDLAKIISARWRTATPEEKTYFKQLEYADKGRFDREMAIWKKLQRQLAKQQQASQEEGENAGSTKASVPESARSKKKKTSRAVRMATPSPVPFVPDGNLAIHSLDMFSGSASANNITTPYESPVSYESRPMPYWESLLCNDDAFGCPHLAPSTDYCEKEDPIERLARQLGQDCVELTIRMFL